MGNQHEIRQMAPFLVRWGAAIPLRAGVWDELVALTAPWHSGDVAPAVIDRSDDCYVLRSYYMSLERSQGSLLIRNLDFEDAVVSREGEFLCIQSGGKMWCDPFPPKPAWPPDAGWLAKVKAAFAGPPRAKGYLSFVGMLELLAPYLEDALIYVADEEDFVDRLAVVSGKLERTRLHQGCWFPLSRWPDTKLDDENDDAPEDDDGSGAAGP